MGNTKNRFIILYAIFLQLITAIFVLLSQGTLRVASLGLFYDLFSKYQFGAIAMIIASLLALIGYFRDRRKNGYDFLLFLPQLGFLILTAGSALYYVSQGHYADGVMRSWQFIFVDQLPAFISVTLYVFAVFNFEKENGNGI